MEIRLATEEDIPRMQEIFRHAPPVYGRQR